MSKFAKQTSFKFNVILPFILGGGFQANDTAVGTIADFGLWNYAISDDQINIETCGAVGRVVSWYTLAGYGKAEGFDVPFYESCIIGRKPNAQLGKVD